MHLAPRAATRVAALCTIAVTVALAACSGGGAPSAAPTAPAAGGGSGGSGVGGSGAGGSAGAGTLRWQPCTDLTGMECSSLQVPLDYAKPGGRKITLALSMVPATAPRSQQQGVLLENPGGPGAQGRPFAEQVAAEYNIVGFDPRGVGASVPALSCDPGFYAGAQPDYIPANAAAEQVLINRSKNYAADCEHSFGWLLPYMTSANMARDLDRIR